MKKKSFLVLTLGMFLEALGSGIGTCSIFCHSFSLSNNVSASEALHIVGFEKIVKSMTSCLSKSKVLSSFCFPRSLITQSHLIVSKDFNPLKFQVFLSLVECFFFISLRVIEDDLITIPPLPKEILQPRRRPSSPFGFVHC